MTDNLVRTSQKTKTKSNPNTLHTHMSINDRWMDSDQPSLARHRSAALHCSMLIFQKQTNKKLNTHECRRTIT